MQKTIAPLVCVCLSFTAMWGISSRAIAAPQEGEAPAKQEAPAKPREKEMERTGRWYVRNGMDAEAAKVARKPVKTTIAALAKLPRPKTLPEKGRVKTSETTLWQVEAEVVSCDWRDDGDVHIVLRDAQGKTLVAELPDPAKVQGSPFVKDMAVARKAFDIQHPPTTAGIDFPPGTLRIRMTGLGYLGRLAEKGRPGLPNGFQIHPVTGITNLKSK